jgi:hypothetical protein
MDKNVVNHKVSDSVDENSKSDRYSIPHRCVISEEYKTHGNYCIENKKKVVSLKPIIVVFFVVICMPVP